MARSGRVVLDASALICLARREPGWEAVAAAGFSADVSAVNLVEVAYRLSAHGLPADQVMPFLEPMIGSVAPFDTGQALLAAEIHAATRSYGLSLADCACLSLGRTLHATVVTADRQWSKLGLDVEVVQVR